MNDLVSGSYYAKVGSIYLETGSVAGYKCTLAVGQNDAFTQTTILEVHYYLFLCVTL